MIANEEKHWRAFVLTLVIGVISIAAFWVWELTR